MIATDVRYTILENDLEAGKAPYYAISSILFIIIVKRAYLYQIYHL